MADFFGTYPKATIADLQNLSSDFNRRGNNARRSANDDGSARVAAPGGGYKKASAKVAVLVGSVYALAMAQGEKSSDVWALIDGGTTYTPVNIVNPGGGGGWTLTTATYSAGVLTSATAAAINATQTVNLKAGRYRISGNVGRRVSTIWPTLKVTAVTGSLVLLDKAYNLATLDAASVKTDVISDTFVLAADGNVKFDLNVKDVNGNQTGATYINFILEAQG